MGDFFSGDHVDRVLACLSGHRPVAKRGWSAPCPAHNDHGRDLLVTVDALGAVVLTCAAGCAASEIVRRAGIRQADVTPPRSGLTTLEVARWLRDARGFSVIPLDHPFAPVAEDPKQAGKVPIVSWARFQSERASDEQLREWFDRGRVRNLAIVTGAISGIVVVDCDSPEAEEFAADNLPPTPMATRTGSGGLHLMFRHPGGSVRNRARMRTSRGILKLDVRADGGYVVAPTSQHSNGRLYEKVGPWPRVEALPLFNVLWLQTESPPPARELPTGARVYSSAESRMVRGRAYLEAMGPAIEGQAGDTHTYKAACWLVNDLDLSDVDALELLREWNQGCVPPWSEQELESKVQHARRYGLHPPGAALASAAGPVITVRVVAS